MALTKEDEKLLRDYAKLLPVIMETSHEDHKMTGAEMIEMGYVLEEGEVIIPEGKYIYKYPVMMAVNHYRRLKRAWLKEGEPGILAYLKGVAATIKNNEQIKIA